MKRADLPAALVRDVTGAEPPVRIRAWDGSEAGPADAPVLIVRSRRALRRLLWAPGEMGLARAWRVGRVEPSPARLTVRQRVKAPALAVRLGALGPPPKRPGSEGAGPHGR